MEHSVLLHEAEDYVGVAIVSLKARDKALAMTLDGRPVRTIEITEGIPLGHKVAMRDISEGEEVVEYGRSIGRATRLISQGSHVHVHNLVSLRW